ncbi:hypothetical protein HEP84_00300 [Streptomyces sp. RLB1-33]|nr:hypothetical protein [Streptomyces sp. RLB1-33]
MGGRGGFVATRNLTFTLERLRVDRQLEERLTHGPDPLHLVFGIDEKTVVRYEESARGLLDEAAEQPSQRNPLDLVTSLKRSFGHGVPLLPP